MKNKKLNEIYSYVKGRKNSGVSDELLPKYFDNDYFKDLFRKDLYKIHGVFQAKRQGKKNILITKLEGASNLNEIKEISKEILKLHSSTRERLNEHKQIYSSIFKITGKPEKIIDLGCGLNPIFLILLGFKGTYLGYDISRIDVDFLNDYFKIAKKFGINGRAFTKDIKDFYDYPKSDVC